VNTRIVNRTSDRITRTLATALHERDEHTQAHCERVVAHALAIARRCALENRELCELSAAAAMHDIGKIGIPDCILLKPGDFNEAEWAVMKTHTTRGERIVRMTGIAGSDRVADTIRHHHEHFDGSGYPDGIAGDAIPLCARIISIVDSYDAMMMPRPYHPPRDHAAAMRILDEESGSKHDPALLSIFRQIVDRGPR